uniref:U13-Austrotoxin-Ht1a_1 n=1 Tax=Hickmania troglodytes TaxID=489260 RepID=A0A482Z9A7_9ARAC
MKTSIILAVTVVMLISMSCSEGYCPPKSKIVCFHASHKCFGDNECPGRKICCRENCGNQCYEPYGRKTNGQRV